MTVPACAGKKCRVGAGSLSVIHCMYMPPHIGRHHTARGMCQPSRTSKRQTGALLHLRRRLLPPPPLPLLLLLQGRATPLTRRFRCRRSRPR
jgi:hypothetical protein